MNINQKLGLGFTAIILSAVVFAYYGIDQSQRMLQKATGDTSVLLAAEILDKIDRHIYNRIEAVRQIFSDAGIQKALVDVNEGQPDDIDKYIAEKDAEWVAWPEDALTPFMEQIIKNELSTRLRDRMKFYDRTYGYKVFAEIFVTNMFGANVAQSGKTTDYYQADEVWWQKARHDGLYVGNLAYDQSAGLYSIEIALRINDDSGNFIGLAKAVLNIEEANRIIQECKVAMPGGTPAQLRLFTASGKLIYSTSAFVILGEVDSVTLAHIRRSGRAGAHFIRTITPQGQRVLTAYAVSNGYRDYKGAGWILAVDYAARDIFTPLIRFRNISLILVCLSAMILIMIAFLTSRAISRAVAGLNAEISMRRKAQEDLHRTYCELQAIQDQLIQAEKLNAIGRLASGVAHEVRNPLGIIKQGIDFLKSKIIPVDEHVCQIMTIVDRNITNADKIICGLVDFSRAGELKFILQDINGVVEKSMLLVQHKIELSRIESVKQLSEGLPQVIVDPLKIEQVLINLFLNAIQAMPSGGKLTIRTYLERLDGPRKGVGKRLEDYFSIGEEVVCVEVEDTGSGIPREILDKIFDPFFTTKKPGEGTGLGLAVSKNIITLHKGLIEVESNPSRTTFKIILRAAKMRDQDG